MILFKKIVLFLLIPFVSFSSHKYYVSLTQIEHNVSQNSLEIIINVDIDDLEFTLNKDYNIDLKLTSKNELVNADSYFKKYLKEHVKIIVDNKNRELNFLGKEYEGDIVYFYLEINNILKPRSFEITNRLLLKYFKDQQNIVKAKIESRSRSKILNKNNKIALINF